MSNTKCRDCGRLINVFEECACKTFKNLLVVACIAIPVILLSMFLVRALSTLWSIR
jgi:hypothetical protein